MMPHRNSVQCEIVNKPDGEIRKARATQEKRPKSESQWNNVNFRKNRVNRVFCFVWLKSSRTNDLESPSTESNGS